MSSTMAYLILLCVLASASAVQREDGRLYSVIRESVISEKVGRQSNGNNLSGAPVVAFTVYLSEDGVYSTNQTIIFDRELWKSADCGYDKTTGVFTAPISGVYSLSYVVAYLNAAGSIAEFALDINGEPKIGVIGYPAQHHHGTLSGDVVLGLEKGDRIKVVSLLSNQYVLGNPGIRLACTTFSAVLQHVI